VLEAEGPSQGRPEIDISNCREESEILDKVENKYYKLKSLALDKQINLVLD